MQAAAVLPSVPDVSQALGMQLPAVQAEAMPDATQGAAWDQADADAGGYPQAQQTDAPPGQAYGQQVHVLACVVLMAKLLWSCSSCCVGTFFTAQ